MRYILPIVLVWGGWFGFAQAVTCPFDFSGFDLVTTLRTPVQGSSYAHDENVIFDGDWQLPPRYTLQLRYKVDGNIVATSTFDNYSATAVATGTFYKSIGSVDSGEPWNTSGPHTASMEMYAQSLDFAVCHNVQVGENRDYVLGIQPVPNLTTSVNGANGPLRFSAMEGGTDTTGEQGGAVVTPITIGNPGDPSTMASGTLILNPGSAGHVQMRYVGDSIWKDSLPFAIAGQDSKQVEFRFSAPMKGGTFKQLLSYACTNCDSAPPSDLAIEAESIVPSPPEIEVHVGGPTGPLITSSPYLGTIDFGLAAISGTPITRTVTVKNIGGSDLTGTIMFTDTDSVLTGQFGCVSSCSYGPLAPGATQSIGIQFNPAQPGVDTEDVTFTVNGGTDKTYHVTGEGTTDPRILIIADYDPLAAYPPAWNNGGNDYDLAVDTPKYINYSIFNDGPAGIALNGTVSLSGDPSFTCVSGCGSFGPIMQGDPPHVVTVKFEPSVAGTPTAQISFSSNDPTYLPNPYNVPLSANVVNDPLMRAVSDYTLTTGQGPVSPPQDWNYGTQINAGNEVYLKFTVENEGSGFLNGELRLNDDPHGDFMLCDLGSTPGSCSSPGTTKTFSSLTKVDTPLVYWVRLRPTGATSHAHAKLEIKDQVNNVEYEVQLNATNVNTNPIITYNILTSTFGDVLVGDSKTRAVVTATNVGVGQATVSGSSDNPTFFQCAAPASCQCTITPGDSCTFEVKFNATATPGEVDDTVKTGNFTLSDTLGGGQSVALSGTVIYPHFEVLPAGTTDFGLINVNETRTVGGTAVAFDGVNDYVDLANDSSLNMQFPLSISAWVRLASYPANGKFRTIVGKYSSYANKRSWYFGVGPNGYLRFWKSSNGSWSSGELREATAGTVPLGEWTHVAVSIAADGTPNFYINGTPVGTGGGSFTDTTIYQGAAAALIGAVERSITAPDDYFSGEMDEVRIYNRTLDVNEINTLRQAPPGAGDVGYGMTHHWDFNNNATDPIGNANGALAYGAHYVQTGTLYVRNTGRVNTGDNASVYKNDIEVSFDDSTAAHFYCEGGCPAPVTLPAGMGWAMVPITFAPGSTPGAYTEDIIAQYISPATGRTGSVARTMTGEAVAQPRLYVSSEQVSSSPPGPWTLGTVNIYATHTLEYYVKNIGTGVLTGDVTGQTTEFTCVQNCTYSLNSGEVATATMQFVSTTAGMKNATIVFTNDSEPTDVVSVDMTANVNDTPILSVTPAPGSLGNDFGTLAVSSIGDHITGDFIVENIGAGVFVGDVIDNPPFYCVNSCTNLNIPSGAAVTVTVKFEPTVDQSYSHVPVDIKFVGGPHDGTVAATIDLSGRGYLLKNMEVFVGGTNIEGAIYDYGDILAGEVRSTPFEVRNTGLGNMRSTASVLYDSLEYPFKCSAGCSLSGIAAGSNGTTTMDFVPVVEHHYTEEVGISGQTSPVAYYPFDFADFNHAVLGSSDVAYDRSGNGLHSSSFSGISRTTGPTTPSARELGEALDFSGVNKYVAIPESNLLDPKEISISAWIKLTAPNNGNIVSKGANGGYRLRLSSNGSVVFHDRGASNQLYTPSGAVSVGGWHHVVVTAGKRGMKIYVDGVEKASTPSPYSSPNTNSSLKIGAEPSYGEYFNGAIDEVLIYDRVLTPAEVTMLYHDSDKVRFTLKGHRRFNSVLNLTLVDTDFGEVKVEDHADRIFRFRNDGSGSFVGSVQLEAGKPFECLYTIPSSVCDPDVDPNQCTTVSDSDKDFSCGYNTSGSGDFFTAFIRFAPVTRGDFSSQMTFTTISGVSVQLRGTGYVPGFTFEEE